MGDWIGSRCSHDLAGSQLPELGRQASATCSGGPARLHSGHHMGKAPPIMTTTPARFDVASQFCCLPHAWGEARAAPALDIGGCGESLPRP
jgi:hypothetical protein